MVERKGAEPGSPARDTAPSKQAEPSAKQPARQVDPTGEIPAPAPAAVHEEQRQATASPPPAPKAPTIDLAGTDSDTNAEATGVIPASPDDRFRNRPPPYPLDAAQLGIQGTVTLMIHVSETGVARGADVVSSSGSASLDQAAIDAVRKWRFHPAIREGSAVPFDLPFSFNFRAD